MTATATARRHLTALVLAAAALSGGAAFAAAEHSATSGTHAVAMYDEDFCNYHPGASVPSSGGFVQGRSTPLYC